MTDDGGLMTIDFDWAETATDDTTTVSRKFQSRADFEAQKHSYSAKIDAGNHCVELLESIPALKPDTKVQEKVKLSKRGVQLLGYAVAELYYDKKFTEVMRLCGRVKEVCDIEGGTKDLGTSLDKWEKQCQRKVGK